MAYCFDYSGEDKDLLNRLIDNGKCLAEKVNPGAANNAIQSRSQQRVLNNCIAGVIAEYCWRHFLNDGNTVARVAETPFRDAASQIDLRIMKTDQSIEVRSSFPRNGIPFAICHPKKQFDIIGPYSNHYKPAEIQKDFYVRTLFHLTRMNGGSSAKMETETETILDTIYQPGFTVHLTGGADWKMMTDEAISLKKNLVADDETDIELLKQGTSYRVVPFSRALDTIEIYHRIKAICSDEIAI